MRKPDVEIHEDYLHRWYVLPRNRWLNIYLHHFQKPDPGRHLHDHPWWNISVILKGWYLEERPDGKLYTCTRFVFRRATQLHTITRISPGGVWTLFITGPRCRTWGFQTEDGWVDYETYLADPAWRF